LEGVTNKKVREILEKEADILVEQIIGGAYAMSAIEGMASGLSVITNLEFEDYTRVFRRYSYLNECPILSATPENIKTQIKTLVKNPELRNKLAKSSRKYVEKYHSETTAVFMFTNIYKKIWYDENIDLINLFHPLMKESYNNQSAIIEHGLYENKLIQVSNGI
jgi:glycosyltransferase involved in cell wall biosynthesis